MAHKMEACYSIILLEKASGKVGIFIPFAFSLSHGLGIIYWYYCTNK